MPTAANRRDRVWRKLREAKATFGSASLKGFTIQQSGESTNSMAISTGSPEMAGSPNDGETINQATGIMDIPENDDPLRRRIFKFKRRFDLLRGIKKFYYLVFPKPTEVELEEKRENEERKRLEALLKSEAMAAIPMIHNTLRRMRITEKPLADKKGNTGQIWVDRVWYNPNSIYLHIGRFPFDTSCDDFVTDAVVTNIGVALRRNVVGKLTILNGVIYRIDRNSTAGLPDTVSYQECMKSMSSSLPPLSFPVGRIANGRQEYANIDDGPHLLIGGETKGGKSNMLNVIIGSIAFRTAPIDVRMMMVDLKGNGIELSFWEELPHLIRRDDIPILLRDPDVSKYPATGIAAFPEQALSLLRIAADIADTRMIKYNKSSVKNIDQWNSKHRLKRDFHLMIFIDEWTIVTDFTPSESKLLLKRLAAIARAAGVHVVTALQTADKTTFTQNMKTNFPMRIAFAFQDVTGSTLMVGDGSAINLEPAGRAVFKHGTRKFMIQTPYISNNDIETIVKKSKGEIKGETVTFSAVMVTELDLISWAISENNETLARDAAFYKFKGKITKPALTAMLRAMEGHTYQVGEFQYTIEPGYGNQSRRVVRVDTDPVENTLNTSQVIGADTLLHNFENPGEAAGESVEDTLTVEEES